MLFFAALRDQKIGRRQEMEARGDGMPARIHPTADVDVAACIGNGTRIWHLAQVCEGARIGENCMIGRDVFIDADVQVGSKVKIHNGAALYSGLIVEDGVYIGPRAVFTNEQNPRAITPQGEIKGAEDRAVGPTVVRFGASIGAGAIILPNVSIGRFAMVAAGAVVTENVPDYGLVVGSPARLTGWVCKCGRPMQPDGAGWYCDECQLRLVL